MKIDYECRFCQTRLRCEVSEFRSTRNRRCDCCLSDCYPADLTRHETCEQCKEDFIESQMSFLF